MVKDYITKIKYIKALQYKGDNEREITRWLGADKCYPLEDEIRIKVNNAVSPIKLEYGDYIIRDDNKIYIMTEDKFLDKYSCLLVSGL